MTKLNSPVRYDPITDILSEDGPQVTCVDRAPRDDRKKHLVALIRHIRNEHHLRVMDWVPESKDFQANPPHQLTVDGWAPFPTLTECKQYVETLFRN